MGPELLSDLGGIALGDSPGAGWIHDQGTAARHQPLVVGSVVPRRHVRRQERHQAPIVIDRLTHRVVPDHDVALAVDQDGAEAVEDRARRIDIVGRRAESDAEGMVGLVAALRRLEEGVERPGVRLGRGAGGIHCLNVDAGVLFHQVDARARPLDLAADRRGHAQPLATDLAEIFDGTVHGAILLDQRLDDVVHGNELIAISRREPGRVREDVMAGAGLRLCRAGQQELVAL